MSLLASITHPIALLLVIAGYVFGYHYERNGNPLNLGDFLCRILWAVIFTLGYALLSITDLHLWFLPLIGALAWLAITVVPHAAFQTMGHNSYPYNLAPTTGVPAGGNAPLKKFWPGFWLPRLTQVQWTAASMFERTMIDFIGMMSVGLVRGVLVFAPALFFGYDLFHVVLAAAMTTIWQPVAYLIGYHINSALWGNAPDSSTWGEFLVPVGWAFSVALLVGFAV